MVANSNSYCKHQAQPGSKRHSRAPHVRTWKKRGTLARAKHLPKQEAPLKAIAARSAHDGPGIYVAALACLLGCGGVPTGASDGGVPDAPAACTEGDTQSCGSDVGECAIG